MINMKTNEEKALELIAKHMIDSNDFNNNQLIGTNVATSAVIIAAKPDWYYPKKEEFPEENGRYLVIENHFGKNNYYILGWDDIYNENAKDYWGKNVIAWTYLPKFEDK